MLILFLETFSNFQWKIHSLHPFRGFVAQNQVFLVFLGLKATLSNAKNIKKTSIDAVHPKNGCSVFSIGCSKTFSKTR